MHTESHLCNHEERLSRVCVLVKRRGVWDREVYIRRWGSLEGGEFGDLIGVEDPSGDLVIEEFT